MTTTAPMMVTSSATAGKAARMHRFQFGPGPYGTGYELDTEPVTIHDEFVRRTPMAMTFAAGHPGRAFSCLICNTAIGPEPFTPVEAATLNPCTCEIQHFVVYSVPVHLRCADVGDEDILRSFDARVKKEGIN